MIAKITIQTDFNGIVIFEPTRLEAFYGGTIDENTNIFDKMLKTDDGEEVLKQGIIVPILAIDDAGYDIEFYLNDISMRSRDNIVFTTGIFPLHVEERLVISDLAVLWNWTENVGWTDISISPGYYETTVRGFKEVKNSVIESCGYEIHFKGVSELPKLTGTTDIDFKVL
ncbi:MAG: hypothetical protein PQJ50_15130 [Spirochaetales bacterium]|nr:hypothetical protein [Spirochaetales bacterium]